MKYMLVNILIIPILCFTACKDNQTYTVPVSANVVIWLGANGEIYDSTNSEITLDELKSQAIKMKNQYGVNMLGLEVYLQNNEKSIKHVDKVIKIFVDLGGTIYRIYPEGPPLPK